MVLSEEDLRNSSTSLSCPKPIWIQQQNRAKTAGDELDAVDLQKVLRDTLRPSRSTTRYWESPLYPLN